MSHDERTIRATAPGQDTVQRILDEVTRCSINLLLGEPFFAHLFSSINKEIVGPGHEVDTLAIGVGRNSYILYINAQFWDEQLTNPLHRSGVIKHEMLHLVFRHLSVNEPQLDPRLLNVAFDLVVNQYVAREQLPDDSIFLESFPDINLRKGQTWFYYYRKLEDLRQQKGGNESNSPGQDMLQNIRSDSHGLERHQPWRNVRNRSELEQSVVETHLDSLLRTAHQRTNAPAWGSLPGEVREAMQALLQQGLPEVNWRLVLRLFATSAFRTFVRNTLQRPSRRYGTTPGIKIRRKPRLLVAIDTSGSIGQEELRLFFAEMFHIWRTGAAIEVVECDTKINRRYPFKGIGPTNVWGRGGTDFNAPIELANQERPDGLIYFTDGYANTPQPASRVPILWVITPRGLDPGNPAFAALPGRKVKMLKSG
jgi:predicted metal-dependent peptidase